MDTVAPRVAPGSPPSHMAMAIAATAGPTSPNQPATPSNARGAQSRPRTRPAQVATVSGRNTPRSSSAIAQKNPGPATGSVVFNVTNKSAESADGSLSVQVAGSTQKDWFTIEGEEVRTFGPGETQTAKINISLGKEVPPGDYPFRLRAAAVRDPDNDAAEGPVSVAKKKEAAIVKPKSRWWLWLIIALVVLAAIGAAVYFLFLKKPSGTAVPDFVNKTVDQAKAAPQGFTITEVAGPATGKAPLGDWRLG